MLKLLVLQGLLCCGILPQSMWIQLTPLPKLCMSLSETWKLSSPVLPTLFMFTTLLVLAGPFEIIFGGGLLHALGLYLVFLSSLLPVWWFGYVGCVLLAWLPLKVACYRQHSWGFSDSIVYFVGQLQHLLYL
jgi:hypothetical protein